MKYEIMNNSFIQMHQLGPQIAEAVKFLNKNTQCIVGGDNRKAIFNQKALVNSPIEILSDLILEAGLDKKFTLVDFTHSAASVPDIFNLTIAPIFIDEKLVINITPLIKRRRFPEEKIVLSDIGAFHGIIVRSILLISYEQFLNGADDNVWIDTNIITSLITSYSMIVTSIIPMSQDMKDIQMLKTILTWYYAVRLQKTSDIKELSYPPLLYKCKIDLTKMEIDNVINAFLEGWDVTQEMSLKELCIRMKSVVGTLPVNFNDIYLLRIFTSSHKNANELMVGISYPPYWMYHILNILSGLKDTHMIFIKRFKIQEELSLMMSRLIKSRTFLTNIK